MPKVWDLMDDIRNIRTLKIHGISAGTFTRSLALLQESRLLSNDALHVAIMEEQSIDTIATHDDYRRMGIGSHMLKYVFFICFLDYARLLDAGSSRLTR
jgi:GNAT superfamily N-acetyltransferase